MWVSGVWGCGGVLMDHVENPCDVNNRSGKNNNSNGKGKPLRLKKNNSKGKSYTDSTFNY